MSINDNIKQKIGLKIKLERIKRNLSQEELSEKSDLNVNSLRAIERGKSAPSISTLARIADAFGITVKDLTDVSKVEI